VVVLGSKYEWDLGESLCQLLGEEAVNLCGKLALRNTGKVLEKSGAAGRTDVFVMSDHGMDKGAYEHTKAADMFLAATDAALARAEDRKDAAGLMLAAFGEEPGVFAAACR